MKLIVKLICLITIFSIIQIVHAQPISKQDILTSLGNKSKWEKVKYILFASSSPTIAFKERSYLIDKESGKARFDGKTANNINLVVLFNFKTKEIDKSYIDGSHLHEEKDIPLQEILDQLEADTDLLFLPMYVLTSSQKNISINPKTTLVNAEKLTELNFKNVKNLNKKQLNGALYLNNKGEIKKYKLDKSEYNISAFKDIGDGILLPTHFTNQNTLHHSVKFSTLAAFTTIEMEKFIGL